MRKYLFYTALRIVYLDKIKHKRMKKFTYLILSLMLLPIFGQSQSDAKREMAIKYVQENAAELGLTEADIENMLITDVVYHQHSGATSVYLQQTYQGIPIEGAYHNINIYKNDKIGFNRNQFFNDVKSRIKHTEADITPEEALNATAKDLYVALTKRSSQINKISEHHYVFEGVNLSKRDIDIKLRYVEDDKGDLQLSWNMIVEMKTSTNIWDVNVDARTGEVLGKQNMTIYCSLEHLDYSRPVGHASCDHRGHQHVSKTSSTESTNLVSGSYRAYALPAESPNHGPHELVINPHYPEASPYGWHDVDGVEGADYTSTRGNNVHAFIDLDDDVISDGDEVEGGDALVFDVPHLTEENGEFNSDAAVVNLFYANNIIHDLTYLYGFDESKGNYQSNNYGNGGIGGDYIIAREAVPNGADPIWNNASWGSGPDGSNGVMSMGIWQSSSSVFQIDAPEQIAGPYEVSTAGANWGHSWTLDVINVEAEIALARDADIQNPTQVCGEVVNSDEIDGKIALIDRGLCEFGTKSLNAQNAGAVGVIICNIAGVNGGDGEELIGMAPGDDGLEVTIPALFASKSMCDRIKAAIGAGSPVTATMSTEIASGPTTFNSAFDNGVIFHEFGHGFNGRFLGGPNNSSGLFNAEQMGEGWSDFFSVAFTTKDTDTGDIPRGVGTYLLGQSTTGRGIRTFPYSTDFNVSPYTYDDIIGANEEHAIGQVWTAVIWDVFWYFVDTYGFDNDWSNQDSGNGKAMRVIMDGVAFVGSSPGFVDARDAIFAADEANFDNIHNCDLWNIFARRGLGFYADQGDTDNSNDGVEDFSPRPTCIEELKVIKSIGDLILPGEELDVTLDVWNHTRDDQSNVIATDYLEDGMTYVAGSSDGVEPSIDGNMLVFELGDMATLQEIQINYQVRADASNTTQSLIYDSVEGVAGNWDINFVEGLNIFNTTSLEFNSPQFSWLVESPDTESEQELFYKGLVVTGDNPVLRFYTKYNTSLSADGGFVDISTDEGLTWFRPDDLYILGGPNAELGYTTFAIPALPAFTGVQSEWVPAYIDMNNYKGESLWIRWRFGSDDHTTSGTVPNIDATTTTFFPGWYIDDVELLDVVKYESKACVISDQSPEACSADFTTFVDAGFPDSVKDLAEDGYSMLLTPNPANDNVSIEIGSILNERARLELKTVDGRVIVSNLVDITKEGTSVNLDLTGITSGLYFVTLQSRDKVLSKKLMIN